MLPKKINFYNKSALFFRLSLYPYFNRHSRPQKSSLEPGGLGSHSFLFQLGLGFLLVVLREFLLGLVDCLARTAAWSSRQTTKHLDYHNSSARLEGHFFSSKSSLESVAATEVGNCSWHTESLCSFAIISALPNSPQLPGELCFLTPSGGSPRARCPGAHPPACQPACLFQD